MKTGGPDGSGLFIKRGMAQALENPKGNAGLRPADILVGEPSIRTDRRSGLTFSGIGSENMGLTFVYRKRAVDDLTLACGAPDSRLAVGDRLINPGRFDKTQSISGRIERNGAIEGSLRGRRTIGFCAADQGKADGRGGP